MTPNDVVIAQLLAENRHLRKAVGFLNTEVDTRHEPRAPREGDDTGGREVEEAYRILVDRSLQGLAIIQDGRIVFANRTAADIIGLAREELLVTSLEQILAFVHPEDRAMVRRRHEDRLQGLPSPSRYEFRARHKDGGLLWVEIHADIVEYRGRPATQIALLDITAHKQMEQTLHETQSRLQDIAATIPGAVCQFQVRADNSWEILFMNESAADLFERPVQELTDKNCVRDVICPGDRKTLSDSIAESRRTLSPWTCEFRITTGRGQTKWLRGTSRPRSNPDGSVLWNGVLVDITDRKRAEEALRESEERFRSLIEGAPEAIFVQSQGRFVYLNPSAVRLFGSAKPEDLVGKDFLERIAPEYHGAVRERIRQQRETGRAAPPMEQEYLRMDGSRVPVETTAAPIRSQGRDAHLVFIRDITQRQQAREALQQSERRLSSIFRATPAGIGLAVNRIIKDVNQGVLDMTGYTREELIDRSGRVLYPDDEEFDRIGRDKYGPIGQRSSGAVEARWKRKNDAIIDVLLSSTPLNPDDWTAGVTFTALDITERKQAEEALRISEERFRRVFEEGPIGMVLTSRDFEYLQANPAFCRMLGYTPQEMNSKTFLDVTHAEHRQTDRENMERLWRGEIPGYRTEKRYIAKNGGIRWASLSASLLTNRAGKPLYSLAMVEDITEHKHAQEQARQREMELLHVTRVSTLGELASGIAHELNQPLEAIANYGAACLALLQSHAPDVPRITRNLQQIVSQSARAGQIIRKMRALVKKKQLQFASVDLNEVVRSIQTLIRAEMADKSVPLTLELSEPLPRVCADTIQMEQVLLNLTRNALDAMRGTDEQARRLTIRTKAVKGDMVQMEVCDTGVGLPAMEPERIFEPFFTTKTDGLGLGLSISRSIVHMHQGMLTAARNPDRGSTFTIALPAQAPPNG